MLTPLTSKKAGGGLRPFPPYLPLELLEEEFEYQLHGALAVEVVCVAES
jgi:hypothetical protein